ncbi:MULTISPECIES: SprT family protein [unclassified Staphylococcus]|uniref:SprT family protein n=1 Tax=unclassified Staphylococcus TaxID=91994 RepID=UPI0021CF22BA|nr:MULTISPECIES: SprT family protein [unclassified Staphylococcus]UXR77833.1 SprT family protein [Staphylococcus sp. IVB6227]UXR81994.1 SprT family protein [Staphylococcus sp. IVB6214]
MNNKELQVMTEQIARQFFQRTFQHRAYFNPRLRTTGGRYLLKTHDIEINPKQLEAFGEAALIDIIKHELCHYFLHLDKKGYQHKDADFKKLSSDVGAPRFCTPLQSYESRANYIYKCRRCGTEYMRIRKVDTKRMRCGKCSGTLIEMNK